MARRDFDQKSPAWLGCVIAVVGVALAYLIQKAIWILIPASPFLVFYPVIFITAWLGGRACGIMASILSAAVIDYTFLPPQGSLDIENPGSLISEIIFIGLGVTITLLVNGLKRAHRELEAQKRMYDALLDATEDHVFILDRNHRFLYLNRATREAVRSALVMLGKDPNQPLIGKSNRELGYSEELFAELEKNVARALRGETVKHEIFHPSPNGPRTFEYVLSPLYDSHHQIFAATGFTRDVHDRKVAEAKLQETAERYGLALKAGQIGLWEMDLTQPEIPVQWSERQYEIFDVDPAVKPVKFELLRSRIHPDDLPTVDREFEASLRDRRDFDLVFRALRRDGSVRWIQANGRAFLDAAGKPLRMLGTNIDVTDRIRAHEAVQESAKKLERSLKAREEMMAVVSHDLRNPLGLILMSANMIRRRSSSEDQFTQAQALKIQKAGERMNYMIEDLLNLAKMETGTFSLTKREVCGCNMVTEAVEAISPLAHEKGIRIETHGTDQLLQMSCDHQQVLRVFSNLLGNAIKFTPEQGLIEVRAEDHENEVLFSVQDTGPGIAEHHLPHVFDRFWQAEKTQHLGTGLGLAIAKGIVDAHGGRIWAESKFGRGASFFFTLPKTQQQRHIGGAA